MCKWSEPISAHYGWGTYYQAEGLMCILLNSRAGKSMCIVFPAYNSPHTLNMNERPVQHAGIQNWLWSHCSCWNLEQLHLIAVKLMYLWLELSSMITLLAGSLPPTSLQSIGCVFCISPWRMELSLLVCCTLRVAFPGRPDICNSLGALTMLIFIDFLGRCLWGVPAANCRS